MSLDQAALDAIKEDIKAQTAALPSRGDKFVAELAAFLARVQIRLAREAAEREAS